MITRCRFATAMLVLVLGAGSSSAKDSFPPARPNIVVILADDLGFSDIGCYGGEIATPNLDRLADEGLRFTQMYNTARCWPTRAALLTGYYAPQVNRDPAGKRPSWAALLPQLLKPAGYRSYHVGKWHVDGSVLAGGFDRSYHFEDWDRYFTPGQHFLDDRPLPTVKVADGYYATSAFADYAVRFLEEHAAGHANAPFFLYLAFISPHFPLHALPEDIEKYKDRYLAGWDKIRAERYRRLSELGIVSGELSQRDATFRPRYMKPQYLENLGPGEIDHAAVWDELSADQRVFQARKMAIHAAMVDRMDFEIGRVLAQIREMGAQDNTLVVFLSDNGADASILVRGDGHDREAAMGSARSFLCLGPGWATVSNTPFRRHKIWVHEGGISTPMIVRWPGGIKARGVLRHTPAHVIDLVPTFLGLAGLEAPASWRGGQRPAFPGVSLVPALADDATLSRACLYWHHEGNQALRVGDYKIVNELEGGNRWALYDLSMDRSESHDLSAEQPERLRSLIEKWNALDAEFVRQGRSGS